ncbi:hypothetical protein [Quadrisphaera sp. KR29]|uniref:hypothetical protein n=1 Tax=Quadrisphaera sp. KR29 TaxID=3461391 RepID=UPI0040446B82
MSWLLTLAVPDPAPVAPPGLGEAVNTLLGWLKWGGLVAGVAGLLICAIMMMIGRRNRSAVAADGAAGIPWVLGGLTVIAFSAAIVGAVV